MDWNEDLWKGEPFLKSFVNNKAINLKQNYRQMT